MIAAASSVLHARRREICLEDIVELRGIWSDEVWSDEVWLQSDGSVVLSIARSPG